MAKVTVGAGTLFLLIGLVSAIYAGAIPILVKIAAVSLSLGMILTIFGVRALFDTPDNPSNGGCGCTNNKEPPQ